MNFNLCSFIIDKHEVVISSNFRHMNEDLEVQWAWYKGKLQEADAMLDNCKDSFKLTLLGESEELNSAANKLLKEFKTLPTTQST